jgi:spermidine/putrescine transport system substrate-binding protein
VLKVDFLKKHKYRSLGMMLVSCLAILAMQAQPARAEARQLVLLTWGEYMDPALLHAFEQRTGIAVREVYFESDDQRDSMLAAADPGAYDVILVDERRADPYSRNGWLASMPEPQPANFRHIDGDWKGKFMIECADVVPFLWGTAGIAYRSDLLERPVDTWEAFFDPDSAAEGPHGMLGSVRELGGLALKSLGYSLNSTDPGEIREAAAVLRAHHPRVKNYVYAQLNETAPLVTGEVVASIMYNGDALLLQAHNPSIEFVLPAEGGNLWLDVLGVSASSRHQDEAWAFINFLSEPRNAARLSEYLSTATANSTALQYLPADVLQNPVIYPDRESLGNSEVFQPLPPRALNTMNALVMPLMYEGRR